MGKMKQAKQRRQKRYYKVVRKEGRGSIVIHRYKVRYVKGEFVTPKVQGSKLMVFESRKTAEAYVAGDEFCYVVLPCHIVKSEVQPSYILDVVHLRNDEIERFWTAANRGLWNEVVPCKLKSPPRGTVFADSVKCLE